MDLIHCFSSHCLKICISLVFAKMNDDFIKLKRNLDDFYGGDSFCYFIFEEDVSVICMMSLLLS